MRVFQCVPAVEEGEAREGRAEHSDTNLEPDVWGNTFLTVVRLRDKDGRDKAVGSSNKCWVFFAWSTFSMILYIANLILQFGLIYYIKTGIVDYELKKFLPPKFDISGATSAMHSAAVNGAPFVGTGPNQVDEKTALKIVEKCEDQPTKDFVVTYFMILFLWFARAMEELMASIHFAIQVCRIPARESADDPMECDHAITKIDAISKAVGFFLLALPKACIALSLTWVGGLLLMVQKQMMHIIFKCVCIQLVINIDSMLMHGLSTAGAVDRVKKTKIVFASYRGVLWDLFVGGYIKFVVVLALAIYFFFFSAHGLTEFRTTCHNFSDKSAYKDLAETLKK